MSETRFRIDGKQGKKLLIRDAMKKAKNITGPKPGIPFGDPTGNTELFTAQIYRAGEFFRPAGLI
jgi:hypothetical protein